MYAVGFVCGKTFSFGLKTIDVHEPYPGNILGLVVQFNAEYVDAICSVLLKLARQQIFEMKFVHISGVCSKFTDCLIVEFPIFFRGHRECGFGAAGYNTTHYWKYTSVGCCL